MWNSILPDGAGERNNGMSGRLDFSMEDLIPAYIPVFCVRTIEMDRCAADAVAHVTGARLGRRSLKFMDSGGSEK